MIEEVGGVGAVIPTCGYGRICRSIYKRSTGQAGLMIVAMQAALQTEWGKVMSLGTAPST